MKKLIEYQAAIDALRNYLVGKNVPCDGTLTARLIENEVINKLPQAQPIFDARDTQYNLPIGTDMIFRWQAIDALCHVDEYNGRSIEAIRQLPSIQPKRGRWHYSDGKPARIGLSFGVICDQCGTESEYCTNFCGECGADMRGNEDEIN